MNICVLSGTVPRPPVVFGDGRVIKFLITTKYRYPNDSTREGVTAVPCTIFDAPSHVRSQLLDSGVEGRQCQCKGRVQRSGYDGADGQRKFATEVIVDPNSVVIRKP